MKKILAVAMVLAMFVTLVACEGSSGDLTSINNYVAPNYTYVTDTGYFTFEEAGGNTAVITGYVGKAEPHAVVVPSKVTIASLGGEDANDEDNVRTIVGIADNAFYYCTAMTSVELPATIETIGKWAFAGCTGLTTIELPNSVYSIGEGAFHGCDQLTSIDLPMFLISIGDFAFYGCSALTSLELPTKLTTIGSAAFFGCQGLTELTFPATVAEIGDMAFYKCNNLTAIDMSAMNTVENSVVLGDYIFWSKLQSVIVAPASGPVKEYVDNIVDSGIGAEETTEEETTEAAE